MITFYDINSDLILEPKIEFITKLKIDPFKVISENTFAIALSNNHFDLFTSNDTFRFTPEFKLKLEKKPSNELNYNELIVLSADDDYLKLLKQYLTLEPCFKIKPPDDLPRQELLKLLKNSNCKNGFLEINAIPQPEIDIVLIQTGEEFDKIELTEPEKINRIIIYDIEKNACLPETIYSVAKKFPMRPSPEPQQTQLHTKLFNLIAEYTEKNISSKIIWHISIDRDKIFREKTNPETLNATFQAIKKIINSIKLNREEHIQKIKALIEVFYSENYTELEKLNITTQIEKFYIEI